MNVALDGRVAHRGRARRSRSRAARSTRSRSAIVQTNDHRPNLFGQDDPVGFAEIRLRDAHATHDVRVDEVVQMPSDLLDALGAVVERPSAGARHEPRRDPPGAAAHAAGAGRSSRAFDAADGADVRR